ncbi:MAG: hypothetical protein AB2A00_15115 [Myxococcota bacterium]
MRLVADGAVIEDENVTNVAVRSGVFSLEIPANETLTLALGESSAVTVELIVDGAILPQSNLLATPYGLYCAAAATSRNTTSLGGRSMPEWTLKSELADADSATAPVQWRGVTDLPLPCPPGSFLSSIDGLGGDAACLAAADVSSVAVGEGLSGGRAGGDVTISVDPAQVQLRVSGQCAAGQAISRVDEGGGVACEAVEHPAVTLIGSGAGVSGALTGTTTEVQLDPSVVHPRVTAGCATGDYLRGFGSDGSVVCDDDATTFARIVTVAPVPGDALASGAALLNAVAAIDDARESNRYLVKIEPGVYDLGVAALVMKPYVDVEGSGASVTVIAGVGTGDYSHAVIHAADAMELRSLRVRCTETEPDHYYATGILIEDGSPVIRAVAVEVDMDNGVDDPATYGIRVGGSAAPRLINVEVRVFAPSGDATAVAAIGVGESRPLLSIDGLVASLDGGAVPIGFAVRKAEGDIRDVQVRASGLGIGSPNGFIVVDGAVVATEIWVDVDGSGYGGFAGQLVNSAFDVTDFHFKVAGQYGLMVAGGWGNLASGAVEVLGGIGGPADGVFVATAVGDATLTLVDVDVEVLGASAGSNNGIRCDDSGSAIDLRDSSVFGDPAFVGVTGATIRVAMSQVAGGVTGAVGTTCVAAYDGSFQPLSATCH